MINVKISIDSDWVASNRENFGNIARLYWKEIKKISDSISLKSLGTVEISIDVDENMMDSLESQLQKVFQDKFKVEDVEKIISVFSSAKENADNTRKEVKAETQSSESQISETSKEETSTTETATTSKETATDKKTEGTAKSEEIVEPKKKENSDGKTEDESEEKSEAKSEAKPQPKSKESEKKESKADTTAKKDSKQDEFINDLVNAVPMRYSNELKEYIVNLYNVLESMKLLQIPDTIYSECLLVSINSGYGFVEFASAVDTVLCRAFNVHDEKERRDGKKNRVFDLEPILEEKKQNWEVYLSQIEEFVANTKKQLVISFDISKVMYRLNGGETKDRLRKLISICKNKVIIFKVPCLETYQLLNICESIDDIKNTRRLLVTPTSMDDMVDYVYSELKKYDFYVVSEARSLIEKNIIKEKTQGGFFGFETLDKFVNKILFEQAFYNFEIGKVSKTVENSVLQNLLNEDTDVVEDPYETLNKMIGLASIKEKIREIVAQIKVQQELKSQGKEVDQPCIHMLFTGNPGTGKTSAARIVARILKNEGLLRLGYFYEIKGRDLCGQYIGETTPKTTSICRDAYGSVLFIDEAYALASSGSEKDYGREAVTALIAEMEGHRDDFCVILAGYKDEMENLFSMNEGFNSRVPYRIDFPNYNREELIEIFYSLNDGKFECEESLRDGIKAYLDSIPDSKLSDKSFGNGRFIRNLYERVWGKAAYRMTLDHTKDLTLKKEDFDAAILDGDFTDIKKEKKHLGF